MEFVEVPAGEFRMGWTAGHPAERPVHTVWVDAFAIATMPVTNAEWAAWLAASGAAAPPFWRREGFDAPDQPVVGVSWDDAVAYAAWIGARLPTEAEWEKAARGGDRRRFPWGDTPRKDRANYENAGPVPVGRFACPECPYGLTDMSGNVWEWTRSPYQPYPYTEADDRSGLDADALWVMRGGGFADNPQLVRTTTRGAAEPGARRPFIGFRVVISPK